MFYFSVGNETSIILSSMLAIVLFCGMQIYRHWLAATALQTIFGGYLSSILFVLILTTKLFPEVSFCLAVSLFAASMIHRVCITTCVLFSIPALYYMNKLSQKVHTTPVVATTHGKRKNRIIYRII
ncbi:Keratinocytes-associated protein, putative [Pediculus humanus corporis]|uniref:Keratinocytes-associated protein, putative n=1 Tax=Pediculus humanus subsp. corporis TaxID=121224 RepID=E0VAI8_PEDHC|nr:Keratinocytes-associated protein, putative [Pediculus humanus corporis]EEB10394.1 Keratinocytes-associated protein, putative [Pediculus humanus corporis]